MSVYISPLLKPDEHGEMAEALSRQPIYSCPRCKVGFLMIDLAAAELIRAKELRSPDGAVHVSLRFWPCLTCGAMLYAANIGPTGDQHRSLRARIESAIEAIYVQIRAEQPESLAIPMMTRRVEQLLQTIELEI